MKKSKAFTLIELIAVLVILAILALIVTPLVLNIIKKARISSDKRSIDAYGRSIELAIADYLLDNGSFPTSIEQLTIEYTGDKVECETTTLKDDGSVYLAECTVAGRNVTGYTYGKEEPTPTYDAYEVGDEVTYNNVNYYVIKDSDTSESTVTLLKATPLTVAEVNQYGAGHINKYTSDSVGTAYDYNSDGTVGGMAYYTSETCGYINNNWVYDRCTTDYDQSDIKYVVDGWKADKVPLSTEARLITFDELISLGCVEKQTTGGTYLSVDDSPIWIYTTTNNIVFHYWTMSQYKDVEFAVWSQVGDKSFSRKNISSVYGTVRPVITISKSALN